MASSTNTPHCLSFTLFLNGKGPLQFRKVTIPQLLVFILYLFLGSRLFSIFCLTAFIRLREYSLQTQPFLPKFQHSLSHHLYLDERNLSEQIMRLKSINQQNARGPSCFLPWELPRLGRERREGVPWRTRRDRRSSSDQRGICWIEKDISSGKLVEETASEHENGQLSCVRTIGSMWPVLGGRASRSGRSLGPTVWRTIKCLCAWMGWPGGGRWYLFSWACGCWPHVKLWVLEGQLSGQVVLTHKPFKRVVEKPFISFQIDILSTSTLSSLITFPTLQLRVLFSTFLCYNPYFKRPISIQMKLILHLSQFKRRMIRPRSTEWMRFASIIWQQDPLRVYPLLLWLWAS